MLGYWKIGKTSVTILILIDGFLQYSPVLALYPLTVVTILILIDGFLQYRRDKSDSIAVYESQSLF